MNSLLENNLIKEKKYGNNFAYILCENNQFLSTEYKVLQSQGDGCFIKTMKMLYNGKIQFYYLSTGFKPFINMIPSLDAESLMIIVSNLLSNIIDVKNNGFLSCCNIDLSFEHIFVDPNTYKVSLIYLPANIYFFQDEFAFENEFKASFIKLISSVPTLNSPKILQFSSDLSNGMLSFQELLLRSRGNKGNLEGNSKTNPNSESTMQIIAMNEPSRFIIDITKDEVVIGKKAEMVDRAVTFNNMISRVHCKINKSGNRFSVTDLQSANGTYVNRVRLQPNVPHPVNNGDIIRLANSDFQVVIK